jgi:hypothetical protein
MRVNGTENEKYVLIKENLKEYLSDRRNTYRWNLVIMISVKQNNLALPINIVETISIYFPI